MKYEYHWAYLTDPISEGEVAVWGNGSAVCVHNIYDPTPAFFKKADLIFVDPPWNLGNLNTFYTKAERSDYQTSFETFYMRLFEVIREVSPDVCYVEVGKQYLAEFIMQMKKLFKYVTFYNSCYYHKNENRCYIIRGSRKAKKPDLDGMDEEDIISWICENDTYTCILDPCMGQGLVGRYAAAAGRKFVGGELNPKRLSVLLKAVPGYSIYKNSEITGGEFTGCSEEASC